MIHLLAHYGVWAAIAFLLGALVAFASQARPGEPAGLLRRSDYPIALAGCLALAVAQVTLGRLSLYFDGALLLLAAFAAGLGAVAALWGPLARDRIALRAGAGAIALTCAAANLDAATGLESDLRHRLGSLLAREGGDPLNFEVSGRDVFVPSDTPGRAALADRLARADGVRMVYTIDALSPPAAARREQALAEEAERRASNRTALAEWERRQAVRTPPATSVPPTERRSAAGRATGKVAPSAERPPAPAAAPPPIAWLPPRDPTLPQTAEEPAPPTPASAPELIAPCRAELTALVATQKIRFAEASAALGASSQALLARLAKAMKQCPQAALEIKGYADAHGKAEKNRRLSLRRARAVADYLGRAGVARDRLVSAGATDDKTRSARETPAARVENRRVELEVR
jgi:outer membrane protein OmpA-like peptidoglycan-associated protein